MIQSWDFGPESLCLHVQRASWDHHQPAVHFSKFRNWMTNPDISVVIQFSLFELTEVKVGSAQPPCPLQQRAQQHTLPLT